PGWYHSYGWTWLSNRWCIGSMGIVNLSLGAARPNVLPLLSSVGTGSHTWGIIREAMGYNARNDKIRNNITLMRQEWEAQRRLRLATVRRFSATLSAKGSEDCSVPQ